MKATDRTRPALCIAGLLAIALPACAHAPASPPESAELAAYKATEAREQRNLATFDDLDFNVFSNQRWEDLSRSHAADIIVHWPDGHTTTGLDAHIADLARMFVYAPDTRIKVHPIKIAQGEFTAVTGVMEGTFSMPMPTPEGEYIPPNGRTFRLDMVTIGRWENGMMKEEWLFWDNLAFMEQLDLMP